MVDDLRRVLEGEHDVAFALLFGSGGRGALQPGSDIDIAIEYLDFKPVEERCAEGVLRAAAGRG
jgi:predicted nucleotidyltransferase